MVIGSLHFFCGMCKYAFKGMISNNGMISPARIHFLKSLHNCLQAEGDQHLTFNTSISTHLQQGAHMQW